MNYSVSYCANGGYAVQHELETNDIKEVRAITDDIYNEYANIMVVSEKHDDVIYWKRNRKVLENKLNGMWIDHRTKDKHIKM